MSDELKIDIQVDADTSSAETKVDNLIEELKKKKPVDLQVRFGQTSLEEFKNEIQAITRDLSVLSELKFSNLKTIETSLRNVAKAVKEYQGVMALDSPSAGKSSVLSGLAGFEDFEIDTLTITGENSTFYFLDKALYNSNLQTLKRHNTLTMDIASNSINSEYVEVLL